MRKELILIIFIVFLTGWLSSSIYAQYASGNAEKPLSLGFIFGGNMERISPFDHISEDSIHVYSDEIKLDIEDASWASYADTNSMDPVFDAGANGIEIKPESEEDVHVGDIISYRSNYVDGLVVHRVIDTGSDERGWYAVTKGDNNPSKDPEKVRFDMINGVLIAVIY